MKYAPWIALSVLTAAAGLASACGGGTPTPVTPETAGSASASASAAPTDSAAPAPSASTSGTDTGEGKPWDQRTKEQKVATMKHVVMAKMGPAFKNVDAKRYEEFTCATCHGVGARDHSYTMPNPQLPKLDKASIEKHPEMSKFMKEVVVPAMAKAIGEEPYNPETKKGFGCGECHPH
jgi:hypothetical protein